MLTTFREKSQITLPKEIVAMANLEKGDNLDVEYENGKIIITPVLLIDRETKEIISAKSTLVEDAKKVMIHKYDETFRGLKNR